MNSVRSISGEEKAVITALLKGKPGMVNLIESLEDLVVADMNDGGMGSLSLIPMGLENTIRSFGRQLVLGEFTDSDGVPVSVALNVDSGGNLYELDVWKVNFAPLISRPRADDITVVG